MLAARETLLADRALTLLGMPRRYSEVRWCAADAVAAARGAFGRTDPVVLADALAARSGPFPWLPRVGRA